MDRKGYVTFCKAVAVHLSENEGSTVPFDSVEFSAGYIVKEGRYEALGDIQVPTCIDISSHSNGFYGDDNEQVGKRITELMEEVGMSYMTAQQSKFCMCRALLESDILEEIKRIDTQRQYPDDAVYFVRVRVPSYIEVAFRMPANSSEIHANQEYAQQRAERYAHDIIEYYGSSEMHEAGLDLIDPDGEGRQPERGVLEVTLHIFKDREKAQSAIIELDEKMGGKIKKLENHVYKIHYEGKEIW